MIMVDVKGFIEIDEISGVLPELEVVYGKSKA